MTSTNHIFLRHLVAVALSLLLLPFQLSAKTKQKPGAGDSIQSQGLKIFILAGKDAVNFIPDHKATTPVLEIRDDNDLPVEGVKVEFKLPANGPGGKFEDGKQLKSFVTNVSGQVMAPFLVNTFTGRFTIGVTAKIDTRVATASIPQANSMRMEEKLTSHAHRAATDWRVIAVAGGAAAAIVAVVLLTGGKSNTAAPPATSVVLTPGGPTFGAPH